MTSTQARSERINLRATKHEVETLRRASGLAGLTLTTYILTTAVARAEAELEPASDTDHG